MEEENRSLVLGGSPVVTIYLFWMFLLVYYTFSRHSILLGKFTIYFNKYQYVQI